MHKRRASLWTNIIFSVLISAVVGVCVSLAFTFLSALFVMFLMDSLQYISFFSYTALILGGASAGFICGKRRRRKGLKEGVLCGAVVYLLIFIGGVIFSSTVFSFKKLLLLAVTGAMGGVMGVNSKRPDNMTYN